MARGPIPKDPEKKAGHVAKHARAALELSASDRPKTAPKLPGSARFCVQTRRWYASWKASPAAAQFVSTDWQRLHMLALLIDRYFAEPLPSLLGEIRLNEALLGATLADRRRLGWKIVDTAPERKPKRSRRRADPRLKLVE